MSAMSCPLSAARPCGDVTLQAGGVGCPNPSGTHNPIKGLSLQGGEEGGERRGSENNQRLTREATPAGYVERAQHSEQPRWNR